VGSLPAGVVVDDSRRDPKPHRLLGSHTALLLDTGDVADAGVCPVAATVDALLTEWAAARGLSDVRLVVAHTHGHNDHTKGDVQFCDRPRTTLVPKDLDAVRTFFGLGPRTGATVRFDLGGRELLVTATPGHDDSSITVVDAQRGLMFTGDTAYPGRLYVDDLPSLRESLRRMVELADEHHVHHVLGCHIEVDRAGKQYPPGVRYHPDEQPLPLSAADLRALADLATAAPGKGVHRGRPMSLYVGACVGPMAGLAARGLVSRILLRR
jgi:glyoxylase-like metal-dependent hydrolase (beta-lactamase superfamily II)